MSRYMVISDLQIPFEHPKALEFCKYVQSHFKIPKENIINGGDEVDEYWGSLFDHDPDAEHTPNSEIRESIDKIKQWADAFPIMRICKSNHGERWKKKAFKSGIPSIMMRQYQEVLETPSTWAWADSWEIKDTKRPITIEHGDRFGGQLPHVEAAKNNGMSTVIVHHHCKAGVEHLETKKTKFWGMVGGCLINFEKYAFAYGHNGKLMPKIGLPVILDDGEFPMWIPL